MLKELKIRNFALIEQLNIEFVEGLNVLTGETGAGKSILLDSIGILCGKRASSEFIRNGEDKAEVEGYFLIDDELKQILNSLDIIEFDENEIFMSREITTAGSNKCKINYKTVPLNIYQKIGVFLFDIHGQNQEQSILSSDKQLELVDKFQKTMNKNNEAQEEVKTAYQGYKVLLNKQRDLAYQEKEDMVSFYEYAVREIDQAGLSEDEDAALREERVRIQNGEKLRKKSATVYELLNNNGVIDKMNQALFSMNEIAELDPSLKELSSKSSDLYYELESLNEQFKKYFLNLEYDEEIINIIEGRIDEINKLKRKYGRTVTEILEKRDEMHEKIDIFSNIEQLKAELDLQIKDAIDTYLQKAGMLSELRKEAAGLLTEKIKEKLKNLNIYENGFDITFSKREEPSEKGADIVEFYFSPNIGEGVQPLKKIASGGEISRVMLALKGVLAEYDVIPSLIFDEIDSGVGGEALLKVAEALERIGRKRQVICVSHSAIMAAFADRITAVTKKQLAGRTVIEARNLDRESDIIDELSRMLGGKDNFSASKEQSKEMILFALSKKKV